jgi:hypothetical protein
MNILLNVFLIFIFLLFTFYFENPEISNNYYISNKIILFGLLFCFQFIILLIDKIRIGCKINVNQLAYDSMVVAVSGVMGYTVFNDLTIGFENYKNCFEKSSKNIKNLNITIVIILFITIIKLLGLSMDQINNIC